MGQTALGLIQSFCYKSNLSAIAPTTLLSPTDPSTLQLIHLFYEVGRDLVSRKCWPQLKRTHTFTTSNGDPAYALPSDYYCSLLDTAWDTTNRWKLRGPQTDSGFNNLLWGYAPISTWSSYRIFGREGSDQFQVTPTPGASPINMQFDYISSSWINNAGTWGTTVTSDSATVAFDDDLMLLGLSVNWPDNKGLQYDRYLVQYEKLISKANARWNGSFKTMLSPDMRAWLYPNVAEGSWNI
jgi:hypothetical protein